MKILFGWEQEKRYYWIIKVTIKLLYKIKTNLKVGLMNQAPTIIKPLRNINKDLMNQALTIIKPGRNKPKK